MKLAQPKKKTIKVKADALENAIETSIPATLPVATGITLVDNQSRDVLGEGRNYGVGFGFCKRTDKGFETVMPISACKDYLNDVVFVETTGLGGSVYGFNYKKQGIYEDERLYLAMSVMKRKDGTSQYTKYSTYDKEVEQLNANYKNIEKFINLVEDAYCLPHSTIEQVSDNLFIISFDKFWGKYTYLISAYTLMLRSAINYTEGDVWEYLSGKQVPTADSYMLRGIVPALKKFIGGNFPEQNVGALGSVSRAHNTGIVEFNNRLGW